MHIDTYTFRARLVPVFIVLLPIGLAFFAFFPLTSIVSALVGLFGTLSVQSLLTLLFSEIGRDLGKKKEPELYESWGGMPTDFTLSYQSALDRPTVERYKNKLRGLLPDIVFPTAEQEAKDPKAARDIYRSCTNFMREKTRDITKYALLFKENVSYGFRRNLWGMKPAGIVLALIGLVACATSLAAFPKSEYEMVVAWACLAINAILLTWWVFRINRSWIKVAGDEYAKQLFAACETL
ncbi:hypothetical protein C4568_03040 [Candidatus Parcubacteria bacterium]|nr:MAG: hypothetical protein C4568_03040 [Candidatus Parcubacteria bacterium]